MKRHYFYQHVHNPSDKEMKDILDSATQGGWILDKVTSCAGQYGVNLYMFFYKDE